MPEQATHPENVYSAPQNRADRTRKREEDIAEFIIAMEGALEAQKTILDDLAKSTLISEDERAERMAGTRDTIQAVLDRIAEERERQDHLASEVTRLERIHGLGMQLMASVDSNKGLPN